MRVIDNRFQTNGSVNLQAQPKSDHLRRLQDLSSISMFSVVFPRETMFQTHEMTELN